MINQSNTKIQEFFLQLVRLGIGTSKDAHIPKSIDWVQLKALAEEQGLSAIVLDAIDKLPTEKRPLQELLLEWIGDVLQNFELRYSEYKKAIGSLASFYNQHGFKMMVLKGYACSLDWPKPEHRPCGDIDIWLFGKQKEADKAIVKEKGVKIDNFHHHHTIFNWRDFTVENHYDFIEVHHHSSSPALEAILKEKGQDDTHFVELYGEKVYLPSPNLHALFLLRHNIEHFVATSITLRQVLDWAFFVQAHGKDVDWAWLERVMEEFGMRKFYDIINAICVEDFGFDINLFTRVQFLPQVKDRVLHDILTPEFDDKEPKCFLPRVFFKYRRWKANGWKYELCYKGSRWSAFWSAAWNHVLKPRSI